MPGSGDTCAQQGQNPGSSSANDDVVAALAYKKLHAFATASHGFYFWNFRAELAPRWSFLEAARLGWVPASLDQLDEEVEKACFDEVGGWVNERESERVSERTKDRTRRTRESSTLVVCL